jgi:hypothetical protein
VTALTQHSWQQKEIKKNLWLVFLAGMYQENFVIQDIQREQQN